ncbi:MAG: DUF3536 domain-containing protein [Gemmatimonadaceae bacterium]|nr:DUF3536 domain-containing protein [Gemmatimonadaceae bacterium]
MKGHCNVHHVIVHAHCYQPPREDPWLELVEAEPSAAPEHDWNARIDRECYARLGACEVRVRDGGRADDPDVRAGVARLVNLYAWCTFDVGATLCEWLDKASPATLDAMVRGDRASVKRWGHGNAIAAPYHHVILPLASPRDRRTEVRWGIADFQRRFGRTPEGMWLPECAADDDTLDLLAEEGIQFTILAPYQVQANAETHGLPVRWRGASGRSLTIVPYDGGLAGEVAFGGLLRDPAALARRLAPRLDDGQARCTTLATDGETFGHHHRNGDRTLALALADIAQRRDARVTNAAALVAAFPPTQDVRLVSPSAWSCAHGVERWRSNCGCRIDHQKAPAQQWRGPLRDALRQLAVHAAERFEQDGRAIFRDDPWEVRNQYGQVVAHDGSPLAEFVARAVRAETVENVVAARTLLEMQRACLRMFTSCAWFFDEVDRIEARQVLRYAARVVELMGSPADVEAAFVHSLKRAHAARKNAVTGADVYATARPTPTTAVRVAAGALALQAHALPFGEIGCYTCEVGDVSAADVRPVVLTHRRTGARTTWCGRVEGHGPSTVVMVTRDDGAPCTVSLHELPEVVAIALLFPMRDEDDALLDRTA